jgi:succinoglycan biosynthesis transport protein ExoP
LRPRDDSMMLLSQSGRAPAPPEEEFHEGRDPEASPGLELSIPQVMLIVRAHWKKILIIALSIMIVASTVIKLLPKSYTSTATLKVDADLKDPLAGEAGPAERGGYIPTEIQLMRSDDVLLAVIDHLDLTHNKEFAAGYSGDPANLREWVKEKLYKDLDIQQGGESSLLINVSATSRESLMAAKLANAVADAYVEQERRRLDDPAAERARRYGEQLAELKTKVSAAEDQLAAFRQRTGITDPTGQKTADLEALAAMEKRLEDAKNARREAEVQAAANGSGAAETTAAYGRVQQEQLALAAQQSQLAQLRTTLGERHPKVLELQSQIQATQQEIAGQLHTYARTASADLRSAIDLQQKMEQAVAQQRASVLAAGAVRDEGSKYEMELDSAKTVYKRALDGYDQIMFASAGHYTYVNIVGRGVPALKSTKPNKVKLLVMAILAGIVVGFGAPVGYELFVDRRVRCRDDLERTFRIPVLIELTHGSIPAGAA